MTRVRSSDSQQYYNNMYQAQNHIRGKGHACRTTSKPCDKTIQYVKSNDSMQVKQISKQWYVCIIFFQFGSHIALQNM